MGPAQRLLDAAAAPTLERIRRDRQKAPTQLQPLLAYLETHLFDPDLDANQLKRACGVRDNSLPIYFHHALSLPPYAYIEDCRLEVACRMLRDTDLKVWQIAQLLGYSTLQVFSRAFDRWSGLRPSVFRRRSRQGDQVVTESRGGSSQMSQAKAPTESSLISLTTLRKAVNGGLPVDQADELARQLIQLYPDSFRHAAAQAAQGAAAQRTLRVGAEEAWKMLQSRSRDDRSGLLKSRFQVASPELFHQLVEKGIEEVRRDPRSGIEIARLSIDCVEALADSLGEDEIRQLEVKAYAWLSNALRLTFDLREAEKFIRRAEDSLRPSCDVVIRTDFTMIKSALRLAQRRLSEALTLADLVVALLPEIDQAETHMRAWIHRSRIHHSLADFKTSTADLWRAHELVDEVDNKKLLGSLYQSLTVNLALEGKPREAARYLPLAQSLFQEIDWKEAIGCLEWAKGLLDLELGNEESAEAHFRRARSSFYEQDQSYLGALASLDLAIYCATQGRSSETVELAGEVIEIFDGLEIQQEALKALQVLRQTVVKEELTLQTLRNVRSAVVKSRP